jgi:hypothetical protein
MTGFAAIKVTRDNMLAIFQSVSEIPAGRERLCWAMLRFPYDDEETFYFIGGNYLGLNQPQFDRQILTEYQLRKYFEFNDKSFRHNAAKPNGAWFVVNPKPAEIERLKNGLDEEMVS